MYPEHLLSTSSKTKTLLFILALIVATVLCLALVSNVGPTRAQSTATARAPMMPLVVPLFIDDGEFTSTLVMVNGSGLNTYADVIVADLAGQEITRRRVEFPPHTQRRIELAKVLAEAASSATAGRIKIMQSPELKGMTIVAQLSLTYIGSGEPSFIDEEVAMPSASGSQTLQAVTDMIDGSPLIAITSLSESTQQIVLESFGGDTRFSKSVMLPPGGTVVTEANGEKTYSSAPFVSQATSQGRPHPVAISLTSDASPGSFAAFGFAPHRKKGRLLFTSINFADPKMMRSSDTVFTGVPMGSTPLLPGPRFVPQLSMANFSSKSLPVSVRYTRTEEGRTVAKELAKLNLPAMSSQSVSFDELKGDADLRNSFMITTDAVPGDVMARLISIDESRHEIVDLLGKDEKSPENGGNHPWSLEDRTESTLLLFNHTAGQQRFNVLISGGDTVWHKTYELTSMQTEAISIRSLIENQIKDDRGGILPSHATNGQVGWFSRGQPNGKGRILQSNRDLSMARNFSCGEIVATLCDASFGLGETTVQLGDNNVLIGTALPQACLTPIELIEHCTGDPAGQYNGGVGYTANSSNTGIVQIASTDMWGNVFVNGVGTGSAIVTVDIEDFDSGCIESADVEVTVVALEVAIDSFLGVGKGQTINVPVTLTPTPSTQIVTLTLRTTSGTASAQFASNNSTTLSVTQSGPVSIKGVTESNMADNVLLEAKIGSMLLDSEAFSVVLVTLSLRGSSSDTVSADNSARAEYIDCIGSANLGTFLTSGTCSKQWSTNVEIVGNVTPSDYAGSVRLERKIVEKRIYDNMTLLTPVEQNVPDNSEAAFRDDSPQSGTSSGKVYDLDGPGFFTNPSVPLNGIRRRRQNFLQWATIDGVNANDPRIRASEDFSWFHRLSVIKTSNGDQLHSGVAGDNVAGSGTTILTWNLQ